MNESLSKKITEDELGIAVSVMAKGKAPGYDSIPLEFFLRNLALREYELSRYDYRRSRGMSASRGHHQKIDKSHPEGGK